MRQAFEAGKSRARAVEALRDSLSNSLHARTGELEDCRKALKAAQVEREAANAEIERLRAQNTTQSLEFAPNAQAVESVTTLRDENKSLMQMVEQQRADLSGARDLLRKNRQKIDGLVEAQDHEREESRGLKDELNAEKGKRALLQIALNEKVAELENVKAELSGATAQLEKAPTQESHSALQRTLTETRRELQTCLKDRDRILEVTRKQFELEAVAQNDLRTTLQESRRELRQVVEERDKLRRLMVSKDARIKAKLQEAVDALADKAIENDDLRRTISQGNDMIARLKLQLEEGVILSSSLQGAGLEHRKDLSGARDLLRKNRQKIDGSVEAQGELEHEQAKSRGLKDELNAVKGKRALQRIAVDEKVAEVENVTDQKCTLSHGEEKPQQSRKQPEDSQIILKEKASAWMPEMESAMDWYISDTESLLTKDTEVEDLISELEKVARKRPQGYDRLNDGGLVAPWA